MIPVNSKNANRLKSEKASVWIYRTVYLSSFALLLFITWLVFIDKNINPDEKIFDFFSGTATEKRTAILKAITFLGNHKFLIPANLALILYFIIRKKKWDGLRVLIVALSSLSIMSLLKNSFRRHRPMDPLVEGITNFSFPSGHAFMSVAFFGLLIYFAVYNERYRWLQYIFISLVLILIFLIGLSRIYLRVHYATDVLAGWICGGLWLAFCFELLNLIKPKYPVEKI